MTTEFTKEQPAARSLTTTLATAFFALSVLTLLVTGGSLLFFYYQTQQEIISGNQLLIAQEASGTVSNSIQEIFSVLETSVRLTNPTTSQAEEQVRVLDGLLGLQPAFRQLVLLDTRGRIISRAARVSQVSAGDITDLLGDDALALLQQGKRYISPIYIDEVTGEPKVIIAVSATSPLDEYQGALVAELNLKYMWDLVDQLKVGESGYAYVVDKQGNLIAFSDTARVLQGENLNSIPVVSEFTNSDSITPPTKAILYQGIKGFSVVGSYVPLGTPDWAVVTELPWQEAYAEIIKVAIASTGIIIALATLAGLGGILLARRLSIPLVKLTETATAIAAGDLDRRANINSRDEVGALAAAFNHMTDQLRTLIGSLEERVDERTRILEIRSLELQTAAQVARDASIAQNTESLLERAAVLLHDKFNYYHIGIFLLDDNEEYAVLRAAGGDAGQLMLARKHKLKVGETGIVGHVAQTGEPRIALDVGADATHFQNPLLPYTRSEMGLPIKVENHVIGVLDVQSDKVNAFDQNSISIMQIVTDQIGVAIERTRLLDELVQNASAVEQSSQEYTARTWRSFLQQARRNLGYRYEGVSVETISDLPAETYVALERAEPVVLGSDGKGSTLAVPIRLRGQTLGILSLKFQSVEVPKETLQLVEEAADRLALALENARLVQDAQRLATRERQINTISAQVQQSTDLETVLQNTIRELGNTLGVPKTFIQIGMVPAKGKDK